MTSCQPVADSPENVAVARFAPADGPERSGMRSRVPGRLVVANSGDEAVDIGSELHAQLGRTVVVVLGPGHRGSEDRTRAVRLSSTERDRHAGARCLAVQAVVDCAALDRGGPRRWSTPRERPAGAPCGGSPGRPAVGGHLDAADGPAAGVRCRPVIVTVPETVSPLPGEVIVEVGALVSVDAVAAVSPLWMLPGWTPMSASTLTVACWTLTSGVEPPRSCVPSRPHDHWIVPAPNTSAPLGAR